MDMSLLLFFLLRIIITSTTTAPYDRSVTNGSLSIDRCQSGRVCMNSCYHNGQLIGCTNQNMLKSVSFDPSFGQAIPSVHLRLIQIDTEDAFFNPDVTLKTENLSSSGMNIRFNISTDSMVHVICADWFVCSLDTV